MFFWGRQEWGEEEDFGYDSVRPMAWYSKHLLALGGAATALFLLVEFFAGRTMLEKSLTSLASPIGVVWLMLFVWVYFSLMRRRIRQAVFGMVCWLLLTAAGNQFLSNQLARSLEARYDHIDPLNLDTYQYVVLLGGGAGTTPGGGVQLNSSGDRVMVAARMYDAGRAKKIICTGTNGLGGDDQPTPGEIAVELLSSLQVPKQDLLQLEGDNTSEEMASLKAWLDERGESGRVGLITSAWHLPRATRLAKGQGVAVDPIPANFLSEPDQPSPHWVIPGAHQFLVTTIVCKEYLAKLVKR